VDAERHLQAARSEIARQEEQRRITAQQEELRKRQADEKAAEQAHVTAQQEEMRQRQADEKAAVQSRYQDCVSRINRAYIANWASKCKAIADRTAKSYNECKSKGTSNDFCELMKSGDSSSDCSLPRVLGTDLDTEAERGRNRCLEESRSGLQ